MISAIISRLVIIVFGTLYPAYASYKAVKTKNTKEYVKWMMYWIVFALFTCAETFTDIFFSWFPFYYPIKIVIVIWLLSPATKGSSILYRKFVHPMLTSREQEIDEYIAKAKEQSYKQVLDISAKGVTALMQTAIKSGGGLVNHLRRSYSLSDLLEEPQITRDDLDTGAVIVSDPRLLRRHHQQQIAGSTSVEDIYFPEMDVRKDVAHIRTTVDDGSQGLVRSGSIGSVRARVTRVTRSSVIRRSNLSDDVDDDVCQILPKTVATNEASYSLSEDDFQDSVESIQPIKPSPPKSAKIVQEDFQKITMADLKKLLPSECLQKLISSDTVQPLTEETLQPKPIRGGRYCKKQAPSPPCQDNPSTPTSAIKAKLVLQPGVMKKPNHENLPEIFVSHSPKPKKRSSPVMRLLTIPKDFKRFSWHELFLGNGHQLGAGQKIKSRSHGDLRNQFQSNTSID